MHRFAFLIAAGIVLSGMPADAAARHKHKAAPSAQGVAQPVAGNRPVWAAPQQCFSNDGYGRFTPCDIGDGR